MSESSPKDPVRVVYHAENRTFARLFNEQSLEEVKDVVRRKLGLGQGTDVSLKQMGSDALLDLEDDDDFQAFRVLLRSSVSVDIQVTAGKSLGSTVPPPVTPQPREKPSRSKPTITTPSASRSGVITLAQPSARPEVSPTTGGSTTTGPSAREHRVSLDDPVTVPSTPPAKTQPFMARTRVPFPAKTPQPSGRKRKVSFDDVGIPSSDKPREGQAPAKPIAITPVAPAETVEPSAAPKSPSAEERPKKKQKKESTRTKVAQSTEAIENPATKASVPKPRKKSTTLGREGKAGTSARKDVETSESSAKKPRKLKKDDSSVLKKASASVDQDGTKPISEPSNPVIEASLQPGSSAEGGTSKAGESETTEPIGVCASIPQTTESTRVQSEVAAAILSGYLSKARPEPPPPPPKRKYVRRVPKKSSASSRALPAAPTAVLDAPANEIPDASTEHRLEQVLLINKPPQQTPDLNVPPCPICLEVPFHIRYYCPIVLKGPDAIRERLEEIKGANMGDQQSLIKELEGLLRDSKVTPEPSDAAQSENISPPPDTSLPRTPNIPTNSCLSEVTVESRDEGSSSESSDDMPEREVEHQELPASGRQRTPDEQPLPDLEAVIRGPAPKRQSMLHLLDRFTGDEDDKDSDSGEDEADLEEDLDEETGRSRRQPFRRIARSSDSESEEESRSPSPSRLVEDTSNNIGPSVQGTTNTTEESNEHHEVDIVMRDVDPPVLEGQDDDTSEETHVGSEDHMVVDESTEGKGVAIVAEEQPPSPDPKASILRPSDAPSNEPQETAETEAETTPNRHGSAPIASEVLGEVEADPIEPADDLAPPTISGLSNADPIETPTEDITPLFPNVTQSTPKPGVSRRIKTRNGQIPDDEADRPVLLEELASEATDEVTPMPAKGKSRRKVTETPASQEPTSKRKSPRFSSLPPSTSTPAAVVVLNHRSKSGARTGKAAKTPAKQSEECSDASKSNAKDGDTQNGARIAPTPSLIEWESLAEPLSPPLQLDEPSMLIDELMSSSPQPDDIAIRGRLTDKEKEGWSRKPATSSQAGSTQGKKRLFDPSSSQIPFPYSQNQTKQAPTASPNGKESEWTTDSEDEPKVTKKRAETHVRYRPLSQLASQATLFSPSLPTPTNKSMTNGKAKKRAADDDDSSSSSDEDEDNGSEHIPRGRRAGSVLETKKRKSLLSRI